MFNRTLTHNSIQEKKKKKNWGKNPHFSSDTYFGLFWKKHTKKQKQKTKQKQLNVSLKPLPVYGQIQQMTNG